jgi:hypothetical protein
MKFKFLNFFLFLWAFFAHLDPDLANQNQCGSGSETLILTEDFFGWDQFRKLGSSKFGLYRIMQNFCLFEILVAAIILICLQELIYCVANCEFEKP